MTGTEILSFLKEAQSRRLSISIFCFCPARSKTGKVSLLLWCGSCSFGTPLYAHLFSLNHSCKQVGSAFFSCRFWIEFKAPGSSSLLCWCMCFRSSSAGLRWAGVNLRVSSTLFHWYSKQLVGHFKTPRSKAIRYHCHHISCTRPSR